MQNLSNLYVPSYLMFMRHTEPLNTVISILIDDHETQNVSIPFVPSYLMLHAACSSASLPLLVSLYEESVKVYNFSGSEQTGN